MAAPNFSSGSARANFRGPLPSRNRRPSTLPSLGIIHHRLRGKSYFTLVKASNGESYLDMWKTAVEREKQEKEFQRIAKNVHGSGEEESDDPKAVERKTQQFEKLLEVPKEDRDRVQRLQVIDRAAAAIAAARAILKEKPEAPAVDPDVGAETSKTDSDGGVAQGTADGGVTQGVGGSGSSVTWSGSSGLGTPGPDFWSWSPPADTVQSSDNINSLKASSKPMPNPNPAYPVMEKEQSLDFLLLPLETTLSETHDPPLPPLQSLMEVEIRDSTKSNLEFSVPSEETEVDVLFSSHAAEAVQALQNSGEQSSSGVKLDGTRWWKETGIETRQDGVVCKWTLIRGVSADEAVEWEEKYWDAADQYEYKELGSEKSGRDSAGNVWREFWKESMWQDLESGLVHIEKTADKWGNNGKGDQWQEQWWEHYDQSGQAEKWAHKWCTIDHNTPLEAGHAHVWHERWGERYDGQGGSIKYTDKWAERWEGDGWAKWGDKWDENFDTNAHGVKQGEAWWEGKHGERWNRTWGEGHNGSGWVHKYGKSSSGEHWDTHVQQDTWYERYPHYGFDLCLKNSVQLREVTKPPEAAS
ncbi:protein LIKE EARLY STARVATION, chloroplastic [Aristolochia californica]|uniref:protein LIKE EARLY STARVATION, chloroplastic n=1 Tax=Aristolochia californica TaxID=171875 RepID=UPI0035D9B305